MDPWILIMDSMESKHWKASESFGIALDDLTDHVGRLWVAEHPAGRCQVDIVARYLQNT